MNKIKVSGKNNKHKVLVYALSTCSHCKAAKKFLTDHGVSYHCKDVDLLSGDERKQTIEEVKKLRGQ